MIAEIHIRPAAASDFPALARIYRACLESADWFPAAALSEIDFVRDTEGELVLLAESAAGEPLGFIGIWEPESFIHHLYIASEHRGQGVGRALLEWVAGRVPHPWRLKCAVANVAAYRFYHSLGWRELFRDIGPRGEFAMLEFKG